MVRAWRIVQVSFAATAFAGTGAKRAGGRWNSPGLAVVYVASSTSLAMLEMLVHVPPQELLKRYVLFEVHFAESLVTTMKVDSLPRNWRKSPPPVAAQRVGDEWLAGEKSAVLRIPSVLAPTEWNYLLNPLHKDFGKIVIGAQKPIRFDPRLVKVPGK